MADNSSHIRPNMALGHVYGNTKGKEGMKRFKDLNLITDEEWKEIFVCKKEFEPGDIVEYPGGCRGVWKVLCRAYELGDWEYVYVLQDIDNQHEAVGSSSLIQPIGTFTDDEDYK